MALVPITVYGNPFTSTETTFLQAIADHAYTDGQLIIGNSATGGIAFATLTQGSGVTITNGNGTITIAASGGGGTGYQAPLSGALTGTNTWTSAPNVIVVDGVPKQKVSTDTTINWTGTTTTVLSVTPSFDVYATA